MSRTIVFLDVETSHLEPGPATIWELALIIRKKGDADREMVWHVRPDLSLASAMSLGVGGYYERCKAQARPVGGGKLVHDNGDETLPEDLMLALEGPEIARPVAQILSKAVIVGANAGSFDVPHIDAWLRANGECLAADYHYLDVGSLVLGYLHGTGAEAPEPPLNLRAALEYCGLDAGAYTAHQALDDARMCRDIWDVVTS